MCYVFFLTMSKSKKILYPFLVKFELFVKSSGSSFFIRRARLGFAKQREAFIKGLIFPHLNLDYHISIKTNISAYAIGKVFILITSNTLN